MLVNGVSIFAAGDGKSYKSSSGTNANDGDGLWNTIAWEVHADEMDANGGAHPDPTQTYHNHSNPTALYDETDSTVHSPIIGWAFDGFPIYGPFGYSDSMDATSAVKRIQGSYQLRDITDRDTLPDGSASSPAGPAVSGSFPLGLYIEDHEYVSGSGDLDEYNGRYCVTPEYPSGTYAYFLNTDDNGDPTYPNMIAENYYGSVFTANFGGSGSNSDKPSGATCHSCTAASVTTDPSDVSLCSGSTSFNIVASGTTVMYYRWQVNSWGGFSNIPESGVYSGVSTDTLAISDITGLDGYQYRCYVTNGCGSDTSNSATLDGGSSSAYTWTGDVSTDWNTAGNWDSGIVPDICNPVSIPGTDVASNQPVISTAGTQCKSITLDTDNNASLTISGSGMLEVDD